MIKANVNDESKKTTINKLLKNFEKDTTINLFKEIKEIKKITKDDDEIKSLFSVNILMELIIDFFEKTDEQNNYSFVRNCLYLFKSDLVKSDMFGIPNILNEFLNKEYLEKFIKLMNRLIPEQVKEQDVVFLKKSYHDFYKNDPEKFRGIVEKYDVAFFFFDESMKHEDFYLDKLEKEINIANIKIRLNNNLFIDYMEIINPFSDFVPLLSQEVLDCMKKNISIGRHETIFILINQKFWELKAEKRSLNLLEQINGENESNNIEKSINRKMKI